MKEKITISVRELAEYTHRSGDLNLEVFASSSRAVSGIRIHQKIQKSRPGVYQKEVFVSRQLETENFLMEIKGRIDGVFVFPDKTIIEEIKTTERNIDSLEKKENPLHWAQAKIYAFIYASEQNQQKIDVRLTYYQLESGEIREFTKTFSKQELEEFFQTLFQKYEIWMNRLFDYRKMRDKSIKNLEFPFEKYRLGQRQMATEVYRTIRDSGQLIVQAPTGIGKTAAVLFPAIKAFPEKHTTKVFYLTPKTTGKEAAEKALQKMTEKGLNFKFMTLTAKDKICPNPENACMGEECKFAKGFYDRIETALDDIFKENSLTGEIIEKYSRTHEVCPFEFSLAISLWSDCVICDYNYAFDPRVYLRRFFDEENRKKDDRFAFLIDEAHNLVDRARSMFSAELFKKEILQTRKILKNDLPKIYQELGKINSRLLKMRKQSDDLEGYFNENEIPENLFPILQKFLKTTEKWLSLNIKTTFRKKLLETYFDVLNFFRISELFDEKYTTCYEKENKDFMVKLFCIDPSGLLDRCLERCSSGIFFSATMTPFEYFKDILGCAEFTDFLKFPSPFPAENLKVYLAHKISTRYKHRRQTKEKIAFLIADFVRQKKGNYLIFFPSYVYLKMVYEIFSLSVSEIDLIRQTPAMTEPERNDFLEKFDHENVRTLVGFAVLGGIFGEGIDLVGERLDGAVIVGVGLPKISFERHLIRQYFEEFERGFEYAYIYPGMTKVLQAAGRVIRTEDDKGTILLIGDRFRNYRYKRLLPEEWDLMRILIKEEFKKD